LNGENVPEIGWFREELCAQHLATHQPLSGDDAVLSTTRSEFVIFEVVGQSSFEQVVQVGGRC
jgi:hypothetical protein